MGHVLRPVARSVVTIAALISDTEIMISHVEISHFFFDLWSFCLGVCLFWRTGPLPALTNERGTTQAPCKHHLSTTLAPFSDEPCSVLALLILLCVSLLWRNGPLPHPPQTNGAKHRHHSRTTLGPFRDDLCVVLALLLVWRFGFFGRKQ